ncbi:hypothetical protein [Pseudomonas nitroreducens]|uniref:hypothetical protein n=1 Tax=Pseudomonas nitroreducens TaxID=46680 RepID=UPI003D274BCB
MRHILLIVLLFLSFSASADYYWTISGTGGQWPSAAAACQAVYPRFKRADMAANGRSAQCVYRYGDNDDRDYLYTSTYRNGTACTPPKVYNTATGACDDPPVPSDDECKTKPTYTKIVQFSFVDGQAVIPVDPEIKDHCIFEPGDPKNCTSTQCEFDMSPSGNDNPADNTDGTDPEKSLQDYLDDLAKKFDCVKTANGYVGCSNAQQTPPDVDPDDRCFPGYSWSGSTCVATPGGPASNNNSGSGSGGGTNPGTGGGDGGDGGTNPGTGGGDGGGDGGDNGGGGGDDDGGGDPKEKLEEPKAGSWTDALKEWDGKVTEAQKEFKEKIKQNADSLKGVFDLNLGEGGGALPCDSFTVWKTSVSLCFTPYEDKLVYLKYALMFMASVLAAFIVLKD